MLDLLFKMSDGQGSFVWLSHLTGGEMEAGSAWAQDKDLGLPLPPPRPVSAHLCHTEDWMSGRERFPLPGILEKSISVLSMGPQDFIPLPHTGQSSEMPPLLLEEDKAWACFGPCLEGRLTNGRTEHQSAWQNKGVYPETLETALTSLKLDLWDHELSAGLELVPKQSWKHASFSSCPKLEAGFEKAY